MSRSWLRGPYSWFLSLPYYFTRLVVSNLFLLLKIKFLGSLFTELTIEGTFGSSCDISIEFELSLTDPIVCLFLIKLLRPLFFVLITWKLPFYDSLRIFLALICLASSRNSLISSSFCLMMSFRLWMWLDCSWFFFFNSIIRFISTAVLFMTLKVVKWD